MQIVGINGKRVEVRDTPPMYALLIKAAYKHKKRRRLSYVCAYPEQDKIRVEFPDGSTKLYSYQSFSDKFISREYYKTLKASLEGSKEKSTVVSASVSKPQYRFSYMQLPLSVLQDLVVAYLDAENADTTTTFLNTTQLLQAYEYKAYCAYFLKKKQQGELNEIPF